MLEPELVSVCVCVHCIQYFLLCSFCRVYRISYWYWYTLNKIALQQWHTLACAGAKQSRGHTLHYITVQYRRHHHYHWAQFNLDYEIPRFAPMLSCSVSLRYLCFDDIKFCWISFLARRYMNHTHSHRGGGGGRVVENETENYDACTVHITKHVPSRNSSLNIFI